MTEQKRQFVPEIKVNNKKEMKEVDLDGTGNMTEVEVPAKKGFNIKRRLEDGTFEETFLGPELKSPILLARYTIKSKHGVKPFFFSNEFEFESDNERNTVRTYAPSEGKVMFEGAYPDAKAFYDTGVTSDAGYAQKEFDTFTVLYVEVEGEICRLIWKMNQFNGWFKYKSFFHNENFASDITDFRLVEKTVGTNKFWTIELVKIGEPENDMTETVDKAFDLVDTYRKPTAEQIIQPEEEINIENIPF